MSSLGTEDRHLRDGDDVPPDGEGRRWPRRVLIGLGVFLGLLALTAAGIYGYARYRFDQVKKVHVPALADGNRHDVGSNAPKSADPKPMNVLVVGSDSRAVAGNNSKAFGSAQQVAGQRADVIKIFHLVPGQSKARVLSIPRDLLVPVAGTGQRGKINDAFQKGPDQLVRTVERQFGIPIDHYVLVTFEGFQSVVNALGGIDLSFPTPARDSFTGLRITKTGCQHLGGAQALAVARSRHYRYYRNGSWHYDPTGDFGRIKRQDVFLQAVVHQAHQIGLTHPLKANSFIGSVAGSLAIDDTWSLGDVVGLARHYRSFSPSQLDSFVLPTRVANNYGQFGDVLLPKPAADRTVISQFLGAAAASATPSPVPPASASPSTGPSGGVQQVPLPEPSGASFNPSTC